MPQQPFLTFIFPDLQKEAAKEPDDKPNASADKPDKSPDSQDTSMTVVTTAEKENELQEDKEPGKF